MGRRMRPFFILLALFYWLYSTGFFLLALSIGLCLIAFGLAIVISPFPLELGLQSSPAAAIPLGKDIFLTKDHYFHLCLNYL